MEEFEDKQVHIKISHFWLQAFGIQANLSRARDIAEILLWKIPGIFTV